MSFVEWSITDSDCGLCASADRDGWWGLVGITHCRECHRTWKMTTKQAHCVGCCEHFSSPSTFDIHLGDKEEGWACRNPAECKNKKTGEHLLVQREDGMWVRPQDKESVWYTKEPTSK